MVKVHFVTDFQLEGCESKVDWDQPVMVLSFFFLREGENKKKRDERKSVTQEER